MNQQVIDKAFKLYCKKYGDNAILSLYGFEYFSRYGVCEKIVKNAELIIRKEKIEKIKDAYSTK